MTLGCSCLNRMATAGTAATVAGIIPKVAVGGAASPFTQLYWNFLSRYRQQLRGNFRGNRRMPLQLESLDRKEDVEMRAIGRRAEKLKAEMSVRSYPR